MITSTVKKLNTAKANVARLEESLAKELASLPSAYGFNSLNSFVAAIAAAAGKGRVGRTRKAAAPKSRKRATITDAVRAKVGKLVKVGRTGSQIAKTLGISLPSVQNIKKALGLVKSSKKPKARRALAKAKVAPKAKRKSVTPKKIAVNAAKPSQQTPEVPSAPSA